MTLNLKAWHLAVVGIAFGAMMVAFSVRMLFIEDAGAAPQLNVAVESRPIEQAATSSSASGAQVAPPASPTAVLPPDRNDCAAIRGTDYRSDTERAWFLANCIPRA